MVRKRIINPLLQERREVVIDCKEMTKDELFNIDECANFLDVDHKLSRYTKEVLPEGPMKVTPQASEHKILVSLGVQVRNSYIKQLIRKFLQKQGLKDWIHVKVKENMFTLHYYNLNDE